MGTVGEVSVREVRIGPIIEHTIEIRHPAIPGDGSVPVGAVACEVDGSGVESGIRENGIDERHRLECEENR